MRSWLYLVMVAFRAHHAGSDFECGGISNGMESEILFAMKLVAFRAHLVNVWTGPVKASVIYGELSPNMLMEIGCVFVGTPDGRYRLDLWRCP